METDIIPTTFQLKNKINQHMIYYIVEFISQYIFLSDGLGTLFIVTLYSLRSGKPAFLIMCSHSLAQFIRCSVNISSTRPVCFWSGKANSANKEWLLGE